MASIKSIKKRKLFEKNDIFLYIALGIIIIALFLSFVIIPQKNSASALSSGFKVIKNGEEMFSYDYNSNKITFNDEKFSSVTETSEDEDNFYITIYTDENKKDFNKLKIQKGKNTVCISESTCFNKYCERMPELNNNGTIYCAPHKLKIATINSDGFVPPIAG